MRHSFQYGLAGLRIDSELMIPELPESRFDPGEPDVHVAVDVQPEAPGEFSFGPLDGAFRIGIPGAGRYLIRAGREILISRAAAACDEEVRLWLLGSAMGALLHQRGSLPLHASAVAVGGGCAAFVGPSGTGKSTLCAFLARRGHAVASDDVLPVSRSASGALRTAPGSCSVRLKADALRALGARTGEPRRRGACGDKYLLHPDAAPAAPLPLRCVYALEDLPDGADCDLVECTGAGALRVVLDNVYRPQFAVALGCFERTFALSAAVANHVPVYRLLRPRSLRRMPEVLDLLEAHWSGSAAHQSRYALA